MWKAHCKVYSFFLAASLAFAQLPPLPPIYPGAIPANSDFALGANFAQTTLASVIDNVTLSIPLSDASGFTISGIVRIDSEFIRYCSKTVNTLNVCTGGRGQDSANGGGAAASHAAGATVRDVVMAYHHNRLVAELGSVLTQLGTNLQNVDDYSTIQEEGSSLTERRTLNFIGASIACVDNAGNTRTDCTITGGGVPGGADTQFQFNNSGSFGGLSTFTTDGINLAIAATAYTDVAQRAAPANPASGTRRLFTNTVTGEISARTSAGTTVSLETDVYRVTDYGAVCDSVTDDRAAINLAIADINTATRGILKFPAATCIVDGALTTLTGRGCVVGTGNNSTIIRQKNVTSNTFVVESDSPWCFHDFMIDTSVTKTAGSAILLDGASASTNNSGSHLHNLRILGHDVGIDSINASLVKIVSVEVQASVTYGIRVRSGVGVGDGGDWSITNSRVATDVGGTNIRHESAGGLKVSNSKFQAADIHYDLSIPDGVSTGIAVFTGNSFENPTNEVVLMRRSGTTGVYEKVVFVGNQFTGGGTSPVFSITSAGIDKFIFASNLVNCRTVVCVSVTDSSVNGAIFSNNFENASTAIDVAISGTVVIGPNKYSNVTTNWSPGTSTLIADFDTNGLEVQAGLSGEVIPLKLQNFQVASGGSIDEKVSAQFLFDDKEAIKLQVSKAEDYTVGANETAVLGFLQRINGVNELTVQLGSGGDWDVFRGRAVRLHNTADTEFISLFDSSGGFLIERSTGQDLLRITSADTVIIGRDLEFTEAAGDPACAAGDFWIAANDTSNLLRKCQDGVISDLDTSGAVRWDEISDPTAAMSMTSNAVAELMGWDFDAAYGATDIAFLLRQQIGNVAAGFVLADFRAADSDATVLRAGDGTNGITVSQAGSLTAEGTGAITATALAADALDAISEIAAGIKRGPDATDTHLLTTDVAAPAGLRCLQMDTDGSVVLDTDTCSNLGPGGTTTIDALGDAAGIGVVAVADFAQTWDWNSPDTSVAKDALTLNYTLDASTDATAQRVLRVVRPEAANTGVLEALISIENLDTAAVVTAAIEIRSAAGGITSALDLNDAQITTLIEFTTGSISPSDLELLDDGTITLTTETTGSYAAGDGEAGAALTGDSATSFFAAGELEVARGGSGVATITGLIQGNGASDFTAITNSSTVGEVLRVTGASAYAWGALDLADADAVTGVLDEANLDANVVLDNAANTYGAFAQSFAAASVTLPVSAGAAPTANGAIAYDSTASQLKYGDNTVNRVVVNLDEAQSLSAKTLVTPTIVATGWTNANHAHTAANSGGVLTVPALPTAIRDRKASWNVEDPVTGDDGDFQTEWVAACTLQEVACNVQAATSVTIDLYERARATPESGTTGMLTTPLVCDENGAVTTSFTDAALAANVPLALGITAVSGTPGLVRVHVTCRFD